MSKMTFWILMFFLTVCGSKEYYPTGSLKSLQWKTSRIRTLMWIILGVILWKVGVK